MRSLEDVRLGAPTASRRVEILSVKGLCGPRGDWPGTYENKKREEESLTRVRK